MAKPPSVRRRFIERAHTLKDDPAFCHDIEARRKQWNTTWPAYVLRGRGTPSCDCSDFPPLPPRLAAAMAEGETRHVDSSVDAAITEWRAMCQELCIEWWPSHFYPVWTDTYLHPASAFVASCLIWNLKEIPEEWILSYSVKVFPAYIPALSERPYREAERWRVTYEETMARLDTLARAGEPITPDILRSAARIAEKVGMKAAADARQVQAQVFAVPVFPGMTSTDLREMEGDILRHPHLVDSLDNEIRKLSDEGMPLAAIARLVGLSRKRVRVIVRTP